MARAIKKPETEALSEEQWHDLMRSLIEDSDAPGDEESENSLLLDVAGRDHAAEGALLRRHSTERR